MLHMCVCAFSLVKNPLIDLEVIDPSFLIWFCHRSSHLQDVPSTTQETSPPPQRRPQRDPLKVHLGPYVGFGGLMTNN
jgi:hypothetical protein